MTCAVNTRCVFEVARKIQEKLSKDQNTEHISNRWKNERLVGICPANLHHSEQHGNGIHFNRHHQGGNIDQEEQVLAWKAEPRQRVCCKRA